MFSFDKAVNPPDFHRLPADLGFWKPHPKGLLQCQALDLSLLALLY